MAGITKAARAVRALQPRPQVKQPIAPDMFLPNHSGIASHPEAKANFILKDVDDTTTGKITALNLAITGDNNTGDTEYIPMVLHGTDATPPTASGFPKGTIYIQYTA